ncbi:MAG: glycosyltransferase [Planctomycetota bacterium]
MGAESSNGLLILIPIYDDWASIGLLLPLLDEALAPLDRPARVLLIDDGSTQPRPASLQELPLRQIVGVDCLRLRRNMGHQRAIAIAIAYAEAQARPAVVVVMDSDGEDLPQDVPRLVQELEREAKPGIVFAERRRRSEQLLFKTGYHTYRLLHRILTGIPVRVGNFSAVSGEILSQLVVVSELWNHYAAAVFQSRLPYRMIPTARGERLDGQSKMSFVGHVLHGLRALSVHGELVGVRLLVGSSLLFALTFAVGVAGAALLGWLGRAPGPVELGLFLGTLFILFQTVFLVGTLALMFLQQRSQASFLPVRDYAYYVESCVPVQGAGGEG